MSVHENAKCYSWLRHHDAPSPVGCTLKRFFDSVHKKRSNSVQCSWRTSGILYPWTGSGKMVHTGTYQYEPVQHGISQYENSMVVRIGMYWYILPVHTFNKTGCFLTHPERVRRDKIKVEQLLCMGYNGTRSFQNCSSLVNCKYILHQWSGGFYICLNFSKFV